MNLVAFLAAAVPALASVNVNTAQQSELERTKGLDRSKAKAIIEYRAATGEVFDSPDDLEKVPGLDAKTLETITPQVTFEGPSYVPPPKNRGQTPKRTKTGRD